MKNSYFYNNKIIKDQMTVIFMRIRHSIIKDLIVKTMRISTKSLNILTITNLFLMIIIIIILFLHFIFLKPNIIPEKSEIFWDNLRNTKNALLGLANYYFFEDEIIKLLISKDDFTKLRSPSVNINLVFSPCITTTGAFGGRKTSPHQGILENVNC